RSSRCLRALRPLRVMQAATFKSLPRPSGQLRSSRNLVELPCGLLRHGCFLRFRKPSGDPARGALASGSGAIMRWEKTEVNGVVVKLFKHYKNDTKLRGAVRPSIARSAAGRYG